jgi:hypothetical protein
LELGARLPWVREARAPVAAARDPEALRAEADAAEPCRAEDAFEPRVAGLGLLRAAELGLLRAAELGLLRAAELGLLRAAELGLLRAGLGLLRAAEPELFPAEPEPEPELERAAVAPLSLAAGRVRPPAFGLALCFELVCLATVPPNL